MSRLIAVEGSRVFTPPAVSKDHDNGNGGGGVPDEEAN